MNFDIKLAFMRELDAGYKLARVAFDRLLRDPRDAQALGEVRSFFHRIAGTAESVGLDTLGALAAVCERATQAFSDTSAIKMLPLFADGLAGVLGVIDAHRLGADPPRAIAQPGVTQPSVLGEERVLSKVFVIDDDPFSAGLIDNCMRAAGLISSYCCQPERAIELVLSELPDLIVLDVEMPRLDGFELCRRIRAHPALQFTPIIFVTRKDDVALRVRGLEMGGNDYLTKPFEPKELVARVRSHLQRLATLRDMAIRDGLTHCYNHKYFKTRLTQEIARARRYRVSLTIGMLDVDHFKTVNDTYGHAAGDVVLSHLANVVMASVRSTDVVARYGGEEFGLLLVQSGSEEAAIVTNRLRERIASQRIPLPHPDPSAGSIVAEVPITVSIGIAQLAAEDDAVGLLQRADAALYEAKRDGRNQVRVVGVR